MPTTAAACLLCGKPAAYAGVWVPPPAIQRRLGARPGKTRAVRYHLCREHFRDRSAVLPQVEAQAERELLAALAPPGAN